MSYIMPSFVILCICIFAVWLVEYVSTTLVGLTRDSLLGSAPAPGSALPDALFYICGALIGAGRGPFVAAALAGLGDFHGPHVGKPRPADALHVETQGFVAEFAYRHPIARTKSELAARTGRAHVARPVQQSSNGAVFFLSLGEVRFFVFFCR
ncbi:hypothetical protein [Mangrovicoccus ximenensis]|uniref:hypothetical protein n=1 Tax=Mangrovicoccus ximenensis TaxID=1911570 RepID=UPI0011AE493E|nr:hypothetical protein [Mangrovicoccus ximenensis]